MEYTFQINVDLGISKRKYSVSSFKTMPIQIPVVNGFDLF